MSGGEEARLLLSMSIPSLLGKRSSPKTVMRSTATPLQEEEEEEEEEG